MEEKVKMVTITLTPTQQEQAKKIAEKVIGKRSISGLVRFWIANYVNNNDNPQIKINSYENK